METNKQKAIREAWIELIGEENFKYISQFLNENGFTNRGKYHWLKSTFSENFIKDNFYVTVEIENDRLFRPKSLQGIENNNGWISILSESDLPSEDCFIECISNRKNPDIMRLYKMNGIKALRFVHHFDCERDKQYLIDKAESYKIIPFNPPIY